MKSIEISKAIRSTFLALVFAGSVALSGCSADAIMGPEQMEGPSMETSSRPHDSQPSNDGCDVGGC